MLGDSVITLRTGEYELVGGGTVRVVKMGGAGAGKLVVSPNGGARSELLFNENGFVQIPEPAKAGAPAAATVKVFVDPLPPVDTPDEEKPVEEKPSKPSWKR